MHFLTASYIFHSVGKYKGSWTRGKGVSYPHTLVIGAFRCKKQVYWILALISAAMPTVLGASCAIRHLPVFFTELIKVSASYG